MKKIMTLIKMVGLLTAVLLLAAPVFASSGGEEGSGIAMELVNSYMGYLAIIIFIIAYLFVILEDPLHMRKSKPVGIAAGIIWALVAISYTQLGLERYAGEAIRHNLLEYAELFLFLLVAMTYINAMDERNVFQALRSWLVSRGFTLFQIFWITGALSFGISPIADNLTTALVMGAIVMAVGVGNKPFIVIAYINIVVAANAGGAFSPFGDITTLMVWQKEKVAFSEFFAIFVPSLVNWLIPAVIMSFNIGKKKPESIDEKISMKLGAKRIIFFFLLTIVTAVCFHNYLHLPPAVGMMFGLGYLNMFSYYLKRKEQRTYDVDDSPLGAPNGHGRKHFDVFRKVAKAEWDTLLFFYGVILCVGGIAQFGYMANLSSYMYHDLGPTWANVLVGVISAVLDNIPVMFAVLTMDPAMSHGQWLLVTFTAGVGGSLLSVGSAAGVALMGGQARGTYTFFAHLKWTPVILLGYAASIYAHLVINARLM